MAKYMLITVIDREILSEQFDTKEEAHNQMITELASYASVDETTLTEVEYDDGEMGYGEDCAYLNDGPNHDNYDWRIIVINDDISTKKINVDAILSAPSKYVTSLQDIVLTEINGVMIMIGVDGDDFNDEGYLIVEDNETSEYYFLCNYPSYTLKDLYEEIVKTLKEV